MATGHPNSVPNATTSSDELEELGGAGHAHHARLLGGDAAGHLVAHDLDGLGRGPMKATPRSVIARAKSVFSEKKP